MLNSISTEERDYISTVSGSATPAAGQFLIFYLGREEYGIHLPRIREIISLVPLELAPGWPSCVKGVVHILGKTIPIIDLRPKLGLAEPEPVLQVSRKDPDSTWALGQHFGDEDDLYRYPDDRHIVVVETGETVRNHLLDDHLTTPGNRGGSFMLRSFENFAREFSFAGLVVDDISEIMDIKPEDIEPAASWGSGSATNYVMGRVKAGRSTKTLLNLDLALSLCALPDYVVSRTLPTAR